MSEVIKNYFLKNNKLEINYSKKTYFIEAINDDIIHVYDQIGEYDTHMESVYEGAFEVKFDKTLNITLNKFDIKIKDDFFITVTNKKGQILFNQVIPGKVIATEVNAELLKAEGHKLNEASENKPIEFAHSLNYGDYIYGVGERVCSLNRRHYAFENWNTDDPSAHNEAYKALYKSIPFYIIFNKEYQYGVFLDNHFHSYLDLGKSYDDQLKVQADGGNYNFYFIGGDTLKDVVSNYSLITGRVEIPQIFTLGNQQSRWSYPCEEEVLELAHNFREKNVKCDVIHLDIDYMDHFKVFTTNPRTFPNFKKMVDELHDLGFKIVCIIDPGTKVEKGYDTYENLIKNKLVATLNDEVYVNQVWPGDSVYPTFNKEKTRKFWEGEIKKLTDLGVDAIWDDMNEPASFKGPLPLDVDFDGVTHKEIHNMYGHFMAKATYDGLKKHTNKRPYVITRAAFSGTQKYSTIWTGDNQSLWHHLRGNLVQLSSLGMCGFAFAGSDLGGFGADTTPELLSRWVEAAIVYPLFRNHSSMGTIHQEPWSFDQKTLDIYRKFVDVRYELIPYYYDLFYEESKNGIAPLRPLVLNYPEDENTYEINDEAMLGDNILTAPVIDQGLNKRMVYLPKGTWYNYFTNKEYQGGYHIVDAPIDTLPLFVKEGSILPVGKYNVSTKDKNEELVLRVFKGQGKYLHYQDDGESYDYENGKYNLYEITHNDDKVDVKIIHEGYPKYKKVIVKYKDKEFEIKL